MMAITILGIINIEACTIHVENLNWDIFTITSQIIHTLLIIPGKNYVKSTTENAFQSYCCCYMQHKINIFN
jgi:hypothetical protein